MSRADFLLEIGCEEIPARMLGGAVEDLASRVGAVLEAAGLARGGARTFCTPRRIAVLVEGVSLRQEDRDEEVLGPPAKAAAGPDGKPTKAALGFAQKMGVEPAALLTVATPKGDYLAVRRRIAGRSAAEVLAEGLPKAVTTMSFPKTMRWGDGTRRFVRPVHWVVALLGSELVPLTLFGIRAGRESDGHRFLGARKVPIGSPAAYEETLAAQKVFADRAARRAALSRRLVEIAGEEGVRPVEDAGLLEEVTDLVEYPGATLGSFPAEFLELPREILVTTLRHHQKAFSTETDDGVSNRFLVVSDTDRDAEGHIRKGNEWVVVGRLEDARFFFHEDRKVPFAGRAAKLENVTFHAAAGSYAEKSRRIESLALALGSIVNSRLNERTASGGAQGGGRNGPGKPGEAPSWPADAGALRAAARLAKCDLTTGLVGEFPELQGIAGGIYVGREAAEGSDPHPRGAAEAIYDQYRPAGAGDALPRTSEGILLALADRLDSLAALATFVGLPTGSKDPFGLRRAAYSVIRLGVEGGLPLGAAEMLAAARSTMGDRGAAPAPAAAKGAPEGAGARTPPGASEAELLAFLFERLEFWLKEKGSRYDTINAVLLARDGARAPGEELPRLAEKVFALERLRELPDSAALVEIHKRCRNILQQAQGTDPAGTLDTVLKQDPEEPEALAGLAGPVAEAGRTVQEAMKRDDFEGALQALVRLRPALSRFFDHVLVMHPDPATRRERLDLVRRTALMIEEVADLKQISISRDELQKQLDQLK